MKSFCQSYLFHCIVVMVGGIGFFSTVSLMSADSFEVESPELPVHAHGEELKELAIEKMRDLQEEMVVRLLARNPQIQWNNCSAEEAAVAVAQANYDAANAALGAAVAALNECENGGSGP